MNLKKLKEILRIVEKSELEELEIEIKGFGGRVIRVKKGRDRLAEIDSNNVVGQKMEKPVNINTETERAETGVENEPAKTDLIEIVSPIVGTFYRAPAPDTEPYVKVGDHIQKDQVVCIVEAMKLMNEIQSEISGTIAEILVENAQPVEFGQVLFLIKPD